MRFDLLVFLENTPIYDVSSMAMQIVGVETNHLNLNAYPDSPPKKKTLKPTLLTFSGVFSGWP